MSLLTRQSAGVGLAVTTGLCEEQGETVLAFQSVFSADWRELPSLLWLGASLVCACPGWCLSAPVPPATGDPLPGRGASFLDPESLTQPVNQRGPVGLTYSCLGSEVLLDWFPRLSLGVVPP